VSPEAQTALAEWSVPVPTVALLALTCIIYIQGFRRVHVHMAAHFPTWRLWAFVGGMTALLIAIASPLAAFDDLLLSVHMVQHMILMLVAPPLLLLGAPAIPLLRGIPTVIAKPILGPILKLHPLRTFGRTLTHPIMCLFAMAAVMWGWHLPGPYQLALRSENWHVVQHSCFVAGAILFWWPVVQPWPGEPHWPRWTMIPYLLVGDVQNTIISAFLVFSERLIYPYYLTVPRLGGISALDDQVTAGAIMWVPGSLFFLIPAAAIMLRMLSPEGMARPLARASSFRSELPALPKP
jgi:cytochrome c oxidase assembly factor CtaG